jgi:hypothetical protein
MDDREVAKVIVSGELSCEFTMPTRGEVGPFPLLPSEPQRATARACGPRGSLGQPGARQ